MRTLSSLLAVLLIGLSAWTSGAPLVTPEKEALSDCTFNVKGNFNGTVVDVTITVSNVSGIECLLLKAGVKKATQPQK